MGEFNLNECYESTLDANFSRALTLCSEEFSKEQLLEFLQYGNMPEKQYAALVIDSIENREEADILMSNLTGCDGKIREAVAFKLGELVQKNPNMFLEYPEIFAKATIDINANICREIIDVLKYLKFDKDFSKVYIREIVKIITDALDTLSSFNFRDKKYTINKQLFKIYWCLEGINVFASYINEDELFSILNNCSKIQEYTIREKVALVLKNNAKSDKLENLKSKLKLDENYYVKNV